MNSTVGFALLAGLVLSVAGGVNAAEVAGLWKTPVEGGLIRIEHCGEEICGRSVASATLQTHPDQTDIRNHDPALRNRPVKGLLILKLKPLGGDRWGDGWIYNPRDGGTYHATVQLDEGKRLKVTGCIMAPICKSQTWLRSEGG
jgi:uncharacterized protein (DUF2147 family)